VSTYKVAISIDREILERLDRFVKENALPSRSSVIQEAVEEKLERLDRSRLAKECAKLDASEEKAVAEQGLNEDLKNWPKY
jgi:metal-responsive CopG/Arc/MetJ family transcriptional regulator